MKHLSALFWVMAISSLAVVGSAEQNCSDDGCRLVQDGVILPSSVGGVTLSGQLEFGTASDPGQVSGECNELCRAIDFCRPSGTLQITGVDPGAFPLPVEQCVITTIPGPPPVQSSPVCRQIATQLENGNIPWPSLEIVCGSINSILVTVPLPGGEEVGLTASFKCNACNEFIVE